MSSPCGTSGTDPQSHWVLPVLVLSLASCTTSRYVTHPVQNPTYAVTQNIERQVRNAKDAGDGDYLVRHLRERLVKDPNDLQARLEIAGHFKRTGNPDLALEHYRLAAEKFPDNADVALLLANTLRGVNQQGEALQVLVKFCNQHQSPPPELLSLAGIIQDDAGQLNEAEGSYRRALRQTPELAYLHNNLGYNLLQQKRTDEAIGEFRRALALEPRSLIAANNLALALLAGGQPGDGAREALKVWESVSDPATAHNNLASILMEQRRYTEARKELDTALKLDRGNSAARHNAQLLAELEKGHGAQLETQAAPPKTPAQVQAPVDRDESLVSLWRRFKVSLSKSQKGQRPSSGGPSP